MQKFSNDLLFVIFSKISVYPDKFSINSKILGTLFYFACKVTTNEHTYCT